MLEYKKRYKALNAAQKQAVDHTEGPLMVVAGPGTGKTELLSLRAANILRKTDMNPSNILCLTFTESGVNAMRERLIGLIGADAYKISVQTFHSFGSEIIGNNPDYFYNGAIFKPADELSVYEIFYDIFQKTSRKNSLTKKHNDEYTQMKRVQATISDLKRAGLIPSELQDLITNSMAFIDYAEPIFQKALPPKITQSFVKQIPKLLKEMQGYEIDPTNVPTIQPLAEVFVIQLKKVSNEVEETGKATSFTEFKNTWFKKDDTNKYIFKDRERLKKLSEASEIYQDYLAAMLNAKLYDYDDMILRAALGLELYSELRLNLQEKYQYIMVDEFQDTNGVQMRILNSLIKTPTGDEPNVMLVGDDDQAIYSFQGADVSNILDFKKLLKNPKIVSLKENYRSVDTILKTSRKVILQGQDRLENSLGQLNKELNAQIKGSSKNIVFTEYSTKASEYINTAKKIKSQIKQGAKPEEIVVLARNKRDILEFLPYLRQQKVKLSYEHDENILENDAIEILVTLARTIHFLSVGDIEKANACLPKILTHPMFNIKSKYIWNLGLEAYKNRKTWFETAQETSGKIKDICSWLIEVSALSQQASLEHMIDILSGVKSDGKYTSPLKNYYFSGISLQKNSEDYIHHLESLSSIRSNMREYKPNSKLTLKDFVEYITLLAKAEINLKNHYDTELLKDAIRIMTAHKAKGLEFEYVYIINATEKTWGSGGQRGNTRLSYPLNMPLGSSGDTFEDKLRLFFVAITRAKKHLEVSSALQDISGKPQLKVSFLTDETWRIGESAQILEDKMEVATNTWQVNEKDNSDKVLTEALRKYLKNYHISATHLNAFLDVTRGGPKNFLIENILHFPRAMEPSAAMGSSVHLALQKAHQHLRTTGERRPIEDVVGDFENFLKNTRISEVDFKHKLEIGSNALRQYLENCYEKFMPNQISEFDFKQQGATLEDVRLAGLIDVLEVDERNKTVNVIDYKTGKPPINWKGRDEFEKIKLHKYKQQLMFYKILIENSRDFSGYKVDKLVLEFIEPNTKNLSVSLQAYFTQTEIEQFEELVKNVWKHIINCEFIDTSKYENNLKGILNFEKDLKKL